MVQIGLWVTFVLLSVTVSKITSNETMKSITASFLKVLDECKRELNLGDNVLSDLYHFWKADHALLHQETGCAIVCMSKKLNLLDTSGKLHHGNAQKFAVSHGAADDMASKLVSTVRECEEQLGTEAEPCLRALQVAGCFRTAMHALQWAPKMDVIVSEVLTEI